jgi:hypothetical protein
MFKWLPGQSGRRGESLSLGPAVALVFIVRDVLVSWYISRRVFLCIELFLFCSSVFMSLVIELISSCSCTGYAYCSNKWHSSSPSLSSDTKLVMAIVFSDWTIPLLLYGYSAANLFVIYFL